ncbi:MAG: Na+/H+ antiporter NhaA [Enterobacteriaceae bacterium]
MKKLNILFKYPANSCTFLFIFLIVSFFVKNSFSCYFYEKIFNFTFFKISNNYFCFSFDTSKLINELFMTLFFFSVGLELKYYFKYKLYNSKFAAFIPIFSGVGGMLFPTIIYYLFTIKYPNLMKGISIPITTDITFVSGITKSLSNIYSENIRNLLLSISVFDDLVAMFFILIFYNKNNLFGYFILINSIFILVFMRLLKIKKKIYYLFFGIFFWILVLLNNFHTNFVGFILGCIFPGNKKYTYELNKSLQRINSYFILPIFAFFNGGINFSKLVFKNLCINLFFGIYFGLLVGKPIGITIFYIIYKKIFFFFNSKEKIIIDYNFIEIFLISILCGIGFTMSIFMSNLSFLNNENLLLTSKLGILLSSFTSIFLGIFFPYFFLKNK